MASVPLETVSRGQPPQATSKGRNVEIDIGGGEKPAGISHWIYPGLLIEFKLGEINAII